MSSRESLVVARKRAEQRMEMTWTSMVLAFGLFVGLVSNFSGVTFPHTEIILVAVLLFGIIEIPRVEDAHNEFVKLVLMAFLVGVAILYVSFSSSGVIGAASPVALVLLFMSTVAVSARTLINDEETEMEVRGGALTNNIKENAPFYAMMGVTAIIPFL